MDLATHGLLITAANLSVGWLCKKKIAEILIVFNSQIDFRTFDSITISRHHTCEHNGEQRFQVFSYVLIKALNCSL